METKFKFVKTPYQQQYQVELDGKIIGWVMKTPNRWMSWNYKEEPWGVGSTRHEAAVTLLI